MHRMILVDKLVFSIRGEHFRHTQNVRRSRPPATYSVNPLAGPSLPYSQIYGSDPSPLPKTDERAVSNTGLTAGPVPRSWVVSTERAEPAYDSVEWRAAALSLIFGQDSAHEPTPLPTLTELCLRVLLDYQDAEDFVPTLAAHLPPHLRRQLLRLSAVYCPLPDASVYGLFEPDGHVDGEAVIIGPHASLQGDFFQAQESSQHSDRAPQWDDDDGGEGWTAPQPIHSLILLSTPLSVRTLLTFPSSLTHLALIHLPSAIPVYRLPDKCPLLEVLDLSFNDWLKTPSWGEERAMQRVAWRRWTHLRILGCRGCGLDNEVLKDVNMNPWIDVQIIL